MLLTLTALASLAAPAPGEPPPGALPHSIAFVNHSLSHGTLGDRFLSLNEAIQLHNGTLTIAQLSPGEASQLSGQEDIAWIDIDANQLPVMTMERDLDVIVDTPHGCEIRGFGGMPVIDFQGYTNGFVAQSNSCAFVNLEIRNAAVGIDVTQTDYALGCNVRNVRFTGQTVAGLRMSMVSTNDFGRLVMDDCQFDGVPTGVLIDEAASGRNTAVFASDVTMTGVQTGFHVRLGPAGVAGYLLERLDIEASGPAVWFERPTSSADRRVQIEGLHISAVGAPAMAVDGAAAPGATNLILRMLDLQSTGVALGIGPLGADFQGVLEDSRVEGDLRLEVGGSQPVAVDNLYHRQGQVTLGTAAGSLTVDRSLFVGSNLTTVGAIAVPIRHSCLQAGSVAGTPSAPVQLADGYAGGAVGAEVTVVRPLAAAQLGAFDVVPRRPTLGGTLAITADLPPGLSAICAVGPTLEIPQLQPLRVYLDPVYALTLTTWFRSQQSHVLGIPMSSTLLDSDWVVQMAVLADPGHVAPGLFLPPGRRITLR